MNRRRSKTKLGYAIGTHLRIAESALSVARKYLASADHNLKHPANCTRTSRDMELVAERLGEAQAHSSSAFGQPTDDTKARRRRLGQDISQTRDDLNSVRAEFERKCFELWDDTYLEKDK